MSEGMARQGVSGFGSEIRPSGPILTPVEKLARKPDSRALAIAAKCWDCQGRGADPGVKWRIGNCEVGAACPLYAVRPYRRLLGAEMPKSLQV